MGSGASASSTARSSTRRRRPGSATSPLAAAAGRSRPRRRAPAPAGAFAKRSGRHRRPATGREGHKRRHQGPKRPEGWRWPRRRWSSRASRRGDGGAGCEPQCALDSKQHWVQPAVEREQRAEGHARPAPAEDPPGDRTPACGHRCAGSAPGCAPAARARPRARSGRRRCRLGIRLAGLSCPPAPSTPRPPSKPRATLHPAWRAGRLVSVRFVPILTVTGLDRQPGAGPAAAPSRRPERKRGRHRPDSRRRGPALCYGVGPEVAARRSMANGVRITDPAAPGGGGTGAAGDVLLQLRGSGGQGGREGEAGRLVLPPVCPALRSPARAGRGEPSRSR